MFPAAFGFAGVPIFFAVSGFCIHLSHQRSRDRSYQTFFLRRFFRIYPPYLLALIFFGFVFNNRHLIFGLKGMSGPSPTETCERMWEFALHVFLVHDFSDKYFFGSIDSALWSIAVEVQLYLLYPLLLWLAARTGWQRTLWITAFIEIGLRGFGSLLIFADPQRVFSNAVSPFSFWFSWSTGAALAEAYLRGEPLPFRGALGFLWPPLFFCGYFFRPLSPFSFTMAALSSTWLMAYCLSVPNFNLPLTRLGRFLRDSLRRAGVVSYSAYLIHQPLLAAIPGALSIVFYHRALSHSQLYGFCLLSGLPIFGLSYLFYRCVELPSISWGKRMIERARAPRPTMSVSV